MLSMPEGRKAVGTRQVIKAIESGQAARVYVARDADVFVTRRVFDACRAHNIEPVEVPSMEELGQACGVQVRAAAAALMR